MTSTASRARWTGTFLAAFAILFFLTRERAERPAPELPTRPQAEGALPQLKGHRALERPRHASAEPDIPSGGARVRILAKESREPIGGARWRVDSKGRTVAEGSSNAGGVVLLSVEAVNAWEHNRLRIWAEGRRDEHAPMPGDARGSTVEIVLAKFHVDFAGLVLDDAGRPIEGAGVVISYWNHTLSNLDSADNHFRTTTNTDGEFRLSAKVWHPEEEGLDGHVLWAGAPGFVPARLAPNKRGDPELVLRLARDQEGCIIEVRALRPDGTPARHADLWIECVPKGDAARRFAELWREPTDPHSPWWDTWKRIGKRETWWRRLDANGSCTLHSVPPGLHRLQVLADGCAADLKVNVGPAPTASRVHVTLEPLRTLTGTLRIAKGPGWHCDHEAHECVVFYDDWPEPSEPRMVATGAFRLMDLPPRVASMRVVTVGHPDVIVALPAEGPASLGEVLVRSAREVEGLLRWPAGRKPEAWSGVRLVDHEGTLTETTTYYTSDGGPRFKLILPRRPAPDAWLVVRLRMSDGDRSHEVRLDGPFDFVSGRPLDLTLPPSVPARED